MAVAHESHKLRSAVILNCREHLGVWNSLGRDDVSQIAGVNLLLMLKLGVELTIWSVECGCAFDGSVCATALSKGQLLIENLTAINIHVE